jgi:hypothetical protein
MVVDGSMQIRGVIAGELGLLGHDLGRTKNREKREPVGLSRR